MATPLPFPVGNRCSIENTPEAKHRAFWGAAGEALRDNTRLRLLSWVNFPFGHTGSRYQNGNYSEFNERARRELAKLRNGGRLPPPARLRVIPMDKVTKQPGLTRAGVLANRQDTTHFMCIMKGIGVRRRRRLRRRAIGSDPSIRAHRYTAPANTGLADHRRWVRTARSMLQQPRFHQVGATPVLMVPYLTVLRSVSTPTCAVTRCATTK